jgi:hypothetical protein
MLSTYTNHLQYCVFLRTCALVKLRMKSLLPEFKSLADARRIVRRDNSHTRHDAPLRRDLQGSDTVKWHLK